jgi:pyruvate kinase
MPETTMPIILNTRKVSDKLAILIDTKGPEIRTGKVGEKLPLKEGMTIKIGTDLDTLSTMDCVQINYKGFVKEIPVGQHITFDDGVLEVVVEKKDDKFLYCKVMNDGLLGSKKTVNVPGASLKLPSLNDKDKLYVELCCKEKIDFLAHSFVRNKEDILCIKRIFEEKGNKTTKIIAKIENQEGVDNLLEILDVADGIMVARGDLAMEVPAHEVPIIQKRMIAECVKRGKAVITATQMLHTMMDNPRPTRAEISDVANAVYDGSDAVMLSGETAQGKYPVLAVQTMAKIIKAVEEKKDRYVKREPTLWQDPVQRALVHSAIELTHELPIKAIITATKNGSTARLIASHRPKVPIYAKCTKQETVRTLALQYGVYPSFMENVDNHDAIICETLHELIEDEHLKEEDLILLISTSPQKCNRSEYIQITTIKEHLKKHNH